MILTIDPKNFKGILVMISGDQAKSVEGDLRNMLNVVGTSVISAGCFKGH